MTALIKYFQALCKDTTACEVNHTSGKTQMSLHASLRCPSSLQQHQLKSYQKAFPLLAAMTFSSQLGPYQVERTQLWHLSLRLTLQSVLDLACGPGTDARLSSPDTLDRHVWLTEERSNHLHFKPGQINPPPTHANMGHLQTKHTESRHQSLMLTMTTAVASLAAFPPEVHAEERP